MFQFFYVFFVDGMRIFSCLILLAIVLLGFCFAVLNTETIMIRYYVGSYRMPLSIALIVSFISGALFVFIINFLTYIKLKINNKCLRRRLQSVQKEQDEEQKISEISC